MNFQIVPVAKFENQLLGERPQRFAYSYIKKKKTILKAKGTFLLFLRRGPVTQISIGVLLCREKYYQIFILKRILILIF